MSLTDAQLEARKAGIGGSDASVVCGLSPWKTPHKLWLEKTGQVEPEDISDKPRVHFGNVLEDVVADEYTRDTGNKVRRVNKTLYHKDHPFILAHLDRDIVGQNGNLECKTTDKFMAKKWGEEGTDDVPLPYVCQALHIMSITGVEFVDMPVLIGGNEYRCYRVDRDEEAIKAIVAKEIAFWGLVNNMIPPDPVNLDDIKAMYAQDSGTTIQATQDIYEQVKAINDLDAEIKGKTVELKELKLGVQAHMGDNAHMEFAGVNLVTWRTTHKKRLDTKALKAAHGAICEEFTVDATERRFLPKKGL